MAKYTFLLPAYKALFLDEMLKSIQNQVYEDFYVIVSDDCSPEDIYSICKPYLSDARFSYRRNEVNMGATSLVSHWNLLVGMCETEYLIMASDDDVYSSNFLAEVDRLSNKYPQADLIRAKVRNLNKNGDVCREESPKSEYMDQLHFMEQLFCGEYFSCIANFVFKTAPFKQMGGFVDFPLALCSDEATTIQMSINGVANIQETTFDFRLSGINISCHKNNESYSVCLKKLEAADLFCLWMKEYLQKIVERYRYEQDLFNKVLHGINFYLFCVASNPLYKVGFRDFWKGFIFMKENRLFPDKKTEFRVFIKWWKNRLCQ